LSAYRKGHACGAGQSVHHQSDGDAEHRVHAAHKIVGAVDGVNNPHPSLGIGRNLAKVALLTHHQIGRKGFGNGVSKALLDGQVHLGQQIGRFGFGGDGQPTLVAVFFQHIVPVPTQKVFDKIEITRSHCLSPLGSGPADPPAVPVSR
jgi:hypothetical protein